jgi:8-oxo-dGTP diphosphatase
MKDVKHMEKLPKTDSEIQWTDCVGVICFKGDHVLMIQRGQPPRMGEWSIPGGRIEAGESEAEAALRELMEETHITADLGEKIANIPAVFEGYHYRLHDYIATWTGGEPIAGDDAMDCAFVPIEQVAQMQIWPKTRDVILDGYAKWQTNHNPAKKS